MLKKKKKKKPLTPDLKNNGKWFKTADLTQSTVLEYWQTESAVIKHNI